MPSARQAVGESAPLSAFEKALAGEAVKVGVGGTAIQTPVKAHAQLIGREEPASLRKEIQDFAFCHRARTFSRAGFGPETPPRLLVYDSTKSGAF